MPKPLLERLSIIEPRVSHKRTKVAAMVVLTKLEDIDSGKIKKSCRCFKIKKGKNLVVKTAQILIKKFIYKNAVLQIDKSTIFSDLCVCIDCHVREISGTNEGNFNLK